MDDSKLIELVRDRPVIFNPNYPLYKDANVRDNVWAEIAGLMELPAEECKTRWKNIRDTYMRRKRSKKLLTGSVTPRKVRKWHLEKHLLFLNFVDWERETITNTVPQVDTLETKIEMLETEVDIEYGTQITEMEGVPDDHENNFTATFDVSNTGSNSGTAEQQPGNATRNKPSTKRKPITKLSRENIIKMYRKNSDGRAKLLSTSLSKPTEQHPIDVFFQSMAMSVKKLSAESQIRAKMDICNIVGQLELEEIRRTSRSSSSSTQYGGY